MQRNEKSRASSLSRDCTQSTMDLILTILAVALLVVASLAVTIQASSETEKTVDAQHPKPSNSPNED
jgi:Na+-transporting NADH:ubiquinone oxidoreductase subunit NqrC